MSEWVSEWVIGKWVSEWLSDIIIRNWAISNNYSKKFDHKLNINVVHLYNYMINNSLCYGSNFIYMNKRLNQTINEQINKQMNEQMNEWIRVYLCKKWI